jgi:hypothetical protein
VLRAVEFRPPYKPTLKASAKLPSRNMARVRAYTLMHALAEVDRSEILYSKQAVMTKSKSANNGSSKFCDFGS